MITVIGLIGAGLVLWLVSLFMRKGTKEDNGV